MATKFEQLVREAPGLELVNSAGERYRAQVWAANWVVVATPGENTFARLTWERATKYRRGRFRVEGYEIIGGGPL